MSSRTSNPTRFPHSRSKRSSGDPIGFASSARMMSPTRRPPAAAGLSGVTAAMSRPHLRHGYGGQAGGTRKIGGQANGLAGDANIATLQTTVLEYGRSRFPRDGRRNHDRRPANARRRDHAQQRALCVDERTAGEPVVHRRGGAKHLIDRAPPARAQRTSDDRNDARAGAERVAPRSPDCERKMADARLWRLRERWARRLVRQHEAARDSSSDPSRRGGPPSSGLHDRAPGARPHGRARAWL